LIISTTPLILLLKELKNSPVISVKTSSFTRFVPSVTHCSFFFIIIVVAKELVV
jgi:hypothetical protein